MASCQQNDIQVVKKMNFDWLNAYPKRDTAILSSILADDFIMINPNGNKQNKADNLANMLDPSVETTGVSFDSVDVKQLTPDVIVLTAWLNFTFKANGTEMTGKNCYQDVYMKRKGKWLAVAAHVTSLGMK
jgi:uncharacterized protein (TIGR02246 family)